MRNRISECIQKSVDNFNTILTDENLGQTIEQIVGHKPRSVLGKHYSGGVLIEDKQTAIETVQYPFTKEEVEFVMNGLK